MCCGATELFFQAREEQKAVYLIRQPSWMEAQQLSALTDTDRRSRQEAP